MCVCVCGGVSIQSGHKVWARKRKQGDAHWGRETGRRGDGETGRRGDGVSCAAPPKNKALGAKVGGVIRGIGNMYCQPIFSPSLLTL